MSAGGKWADLMPRILSAVVMVVVAGGAVWAGGPVFLVFVALVCAVMAWELARMLGPDLPGLAYGLAALTGLAVFGSPLLPHSGVLALVPALAGAALMPRDRGLVAVFVLWIALAGMGFVTIRGVFGIPGITWLICVVAATDIAGYFVGKSVGGPKFWPRVSPKKTWSGTAGGWIAAALVGLAFSGLFGHGPWVMALSVVAAFASQAGDAAKSAVKRKVGVKDSSNLIPGHGGFLDRFDGMMGAALVVLIVGHLLGFLPGVL